MNYQRNISSNQISSKASNLFDKLLVVGFTALLTNCFSAMFWLMINSLVLFGNGWWLEEENVT